MHGKFAFLLAAGALSVAAGSTAAQQAPPAPAAYSLATYYRCNQGDDDKADSLVRKSIGAIYDRHLAAGELTAWGWLAHTFGGNWRRVAYAVAPTRDALFDARAKIGQEVQAMTAAAKTPAQNLYALCPSHDDYLWAVVANAEGAAPTGSARSPTALSTYYQCDMAREGRADEIFQATLAPLFNKHMKAGHFKNWAWYRHDMGGRARRLSTMDGPDMKSLLNAWDMVFQEARETAPLAFQEFLSICPSHDDYVWNVVTSKP